MNWIAAKSTYEPMSISSNFELDLFGVDKKVSVLLICSEEYPECAKISEDYKKAVKVFDKDIYGIITDSQFI